jgi:hypothetical protein
MKQFTAIFIIYVFLMNFPVFSQTKPKTEKEKEEEFKAKIVDYAKLLVKLLI